MNSDAPTRPRSLADQVVAILSDDILLRRMRPGAALKEAELCDRFNISRPAVREALNRLEALGLVENTPRKGARVSDFSPDELNDLVGFHAAVFSHTCMLAAQRRTEDELAAIKAACDHLERLAQSEANAEEYELARIKCYAAIERAIGPTYRLSRRRAFVMRIWNPYSVDAVATKEARLASARRWKKLARLIAAHDGEGARLHFMTMANATRAPMLAACKAWRAHRAANETQDE